jgi:Alpha-L-arabinofuranosidase B (ABFB) domain
MAGEAPSVGSFPNAPGMVTITWDHSGDDVFWFHVELESPWSFWFADRDKRGWSVSGLQPAHTYRFRVCAVYELEGSCSDWTTVTTLPPPAQETPVTTPPPPEASPLLPAFVGSFEPLAIPGMLARHRNSLGEVSAITTDLDRADSTFRIHPIGNGDLIRLEASNFPGCFLRHQSFRVHLHRDDGSDLFRQDSTFKTGRRGLFGWTRLESVNFPGHFLRHRNFELWLDADDGSPLFAEDATWRRLPPPLRNGPPGAISIRSDNFPARYMRHRDALAFITPVHSDLDRRDATFVIRKALLLPGDPASPGFEGAHEISVSLESVNFPGHFLRHQGFRLKLHQNDGSVLFRQDASFMFQGGNDVEGNRGFSLESVNFPGHFVRHSNFELWLAESDGSTLFAQDASWWPAPSFLS